MFEAFNSERDRGIEFTIDVFYRMLSDKFIDSLWNLQVYRAVKRYDDACLYHKRLYNLANYIEGYQRTKNDKFAYFSYPERKTLFEIDDVSIVDGRVVFLPDKFTEAFHGVDVDRVRICGNCKRVFWVKRLDMKGCTVLCSKVLRTRKWREKTTTEQRTKYKINRILKDSKKGEN
jgi:hypothetical protein